MEGEYLESYFVVDNKNIKKKYFDKIYQEAPFIVCACGCGAITKSKDKYGRDKRFINGHNGRKYSSPKQYRKEWRKRNKKILYDKKIKRGHDLKRKAIELFDGKCMRCFLKYDGKNGCVFQFHHRNPSEKIFNVNTRTFVSYAWKRILEELSKCDMLCANCHYIIENEEY